MFINILIKEMPERWDEIIKKYGARVGNGDKIHGILVRMDSEGVTLETEGVGETGDIEVTILAEDISKIRCKSTGDEWVSF